MKRLLLFLMVILVMACKNQEKKIITISTTDYATLKKEAVGKLLVINIFASWCSACNNEMPELTAFYNNIDKNKIDIIGLSVDHNPKDLEDFIKKHNIPFNVYLTDKQLQLELNVKSIPTMIIYNNNGDYYTKITGAVTKDQLAAFAKLQR